MAVCTPKSSHKLRALFLNVCQRVANHNGVGHSNIQNTVIYTYMTSTTWEQKARELFKMAKLM